MNKKKYCVYDNPATMCREEYIDGRKISSITEQELSNPRYEEAIYPYHNIHNGWGRWKTGQYKGNRDAIPFAISDAEGSMT